MVTFQFLSDLHLEDNDEYLNPLDFVTPNSEILILAGDIGSLYKKEQLQTFLFEICKLFKLVIYVIGNHEWYKMTNYAPLPHQVLEQRIKDINSLISNLYILNRKSIKIGNICIAGATLWSNPMNNFNSYIVRIHKINQEKYKELHNKDLNFIINIKKYCESNNLKLLVVTHHPPTLKVINNKKCKKNPNIYGTNLEYLFEDDIIKAWICGHTHKNYNTVINNCKIVSNQKGKDKDKILDFSKTKFIKI